MSSASSISTGRRLAIAAILAIGPLSGLSPVAAQSLKGVPTNQDLIDLLKNPTAAPADRVLFPGLTPLPALPVFPIDINPITDQPLRHDPRPDTISFDFPSMGQLGIDPNTGAPYRNLELPPNEMDFITNRDAAIRLGKALFWDMQVGSDGVQACASCHFHAGADNRATNQLNPGVNAGDSTLQVKGKNKTLTTADFPFHELRNPAIPGEPLLNPENVVSQANDVASSMGVLYREFVDIPTPGPGAFIPGTNPPVLKPDIGLAVPDPVGEAFQGVRRVEPRNTPTVFASAFNYNNFWDGRARHEFNAGSPFGASDPFSHLFVDNAGTLEAHRTLIKLSSVASLATGPPLSNFEMSFNKRFWAKIGKKLLQDGVVPLANQLVDPNDSVLGSLSNQQLMPGMPGLSVSYADLIEQAFGAEYWWNASQHLESVADANDPFDCVALTIVPGAALPTATNQYTQKEANFALFFALSIQVFTEILLPDDSPFDQFHDANPFEFLGVVTDISPDPGVQVVGLSERQLFGYDLFQGSNLSQRNTLVRSGNCNICHFGPELTENSVTNTLGLAIPDAVTGEDKVITGFLLEKLLKEPAMRAVELDDMNFALDANGLPSGHGLLDTGIYNIGVTPITDDVGRGADDPFGFPLSFAALALRHAGFPVGELQSMAPPVNPIPGHLAPSLSTFPISLAFPTIGESIFLPDTISSTPEVLVIPSGSYPNPNRVGRMGSFKAPHLKNIELSGPYFHNGGKLTLRQVIDFYARGGDFPFTNALHRDPLIVDLHVNIDAKFTETDKDALVDFLISLTDERVKYKRAPFDSPEIFVPIDGTAPDNNGGRAALLSDPKFMHVPATGAAGQATPLSSFLDVSSVQGSPGLDHFDAEATTFLMSFRRSLALPGIGGVSKLDIVSFDPVTSTFSLYFDGSDVGLLTSKIDGMCLLPDGDILLSFTTQVMIPGLIGGPSGNLIDDSDIVRFTPTSLGSTTAGSFTFYFDGSDVGLTRSGEDIDTITFSRNGNLVVSTVGPGAVPGLAGIRDEDLIEFEATQLGADTVGTFSLYFDGSDVGLTADSEDIDGAFVGIDGAIFLTLFGNFDVSGVAGSGQDVLRFAPTSLGSTTAGTFDAFLLASDMMLPGTARLSSFFIK
jgi:cytochrome c peroxidase